MKTWDPRDILYMNHSCFDNSTLIPDRPHQSLEYYYLIFYFKINKIQEEESILKENACRDTYSAEIQLTFQVKNEEK